MRRWWPVIALALGSLMMVSHGCRRPSSGKVDTAATPRMSYAEALAGAREAFERKDWRQTADLAGMALVYKPDDPEALSLRGQSYYELEQYDQAVPDLQKAALARDDAELYRKLTDALDALNRVEEAQEAAAQAARLAPDDADAHLANGLLLLELEEFDKAHATLAIADDLLPENPVVLLALARSSLGRGKYEEAIDEAERAVRVAAEEALSAGTQPTGEDLLAMTVQVQAYYRKGDEESRRVAARLVQQYLEDVGQDWPARAAMAWALLDVERAREGLKCVEGATGGNEAQAQALAARAACLAALGQDFKKAEKDMQQALSYLTTPPPRYLAVKGWIAYKLGQKQEAIKGFEAALAATRTPSERAKWQKQLDKVRGAKTPAVGNRGR